MLRHVSVLGPSSGSYISLTKVTLLKVILISLFLFSIVVACRIVLCCKECLVMDVRPVFCSPDLTPLDFYLWGTLKDVVYRKKPAMLGDLRAEIRAACAAIPINTSTKVAQSTARHCNRCLAANGNHFEYLH